MKVFDATESPGFRLATEKDLIEARRVLELVRQITGGACIDCVALLVYSLIVLADMQQHPVAAIRDTIRMLEEPLKRHGGPS